MFRIALTRVQYYGKHITMYCSTEYCAEYNTEHNSTLENVVRNT